MSLFDVIRYPIDINFRAEDLERIPFHIISEWWRNLIESRKITDKFPSDYVENLLRYNVHQIWRHLAIRRGANWYQDALNDLKRRIREYDE